MEKSEEVKAVPAKEVREESAEKDIKKVKKDGVLGLEETLNPDHSFSDEQHVRISEAGFEPATVRQELGLALLKKEPKITLTEAIARAKAKYAK